MTDTTKLEKWAYPFKTAGASSTEVTDPQLYYEALAKADNGFYPMGANGLWHGGVHFDANTGALLDQSAVRCIADGEVIAYRIDERYPTSQYGEGPTAMHLPFSSGFVLIKHRLELPALPTAATPASAATPAAPATATPTTATPTATPGTPAPVTATPATPTTAPAAEALTFYSLYMHLLDWAGYCAAGAPTPAAFLAPSLYTVSTRPSDPQLGLRVRKEASGGSTQVLALLPKGCKVTLGIADPLKPDWKPLLSIDEGTAIPPLASGVIGWVYNPELTGNSVADLAKDEEPALTLSHQGLRVRKDGKLTGTIIGVLPRGAQLKVGAKEASGYCKVLEILDYHGVPALPSGADGKPLGYVYHADLDASRTPPAFDAVTLLPTPQPIKAGELIGHLGQYQNHDDAAPKALLHLEVFSCDDVPAFIAKSQARATSLPESEKTLLRVQPGTKLVTHTASMTAANPPTVRDPGIEIGVSRSIALAVLNNLPTERKIQTSTPMLGGAPVVTQWWHLDNAFADKNGNLISGWLADVIPSRDSTTGTRHSPWEWQGFDFISETTSASEQLANHLAGQCLLSEAELPDYQMHISAADNGPIKTRLYDIIDGADGTARNEKLSVAEIRAALSKPWHAQSISQLISHYESEWYWQDAKWDELDKLMEHTPATPNTDWLAEKARIKTLSWWDKLAGQHGITAGGMAWHFHATGLLSAFHRKRMCCELDIEKFNKIFGSGALFTARNMPSACASHNVDKQIFINLLNKSFDKYEFSKCIYKVHFLAQCYHESDNFKTTMEYASGNDYDLSAHPPTVCTPLTEASRTCKRHRQIMAEGNTTIGDGPKYKGKGLIQITWKSAYEKYKAYSGIDCISNPQVLCEDIDHAVNVSFWFWTIFKGENLNSKIDRYYSELDGGNMSTEEKDNEVVRKITKVVNGGSNHLAERQALFKKIKGELK